MNINKTRLSLNTFCKANARRTIINNFIFIYIYSSSIDGVSLFPLERVNCQWGTRFYCQLSLQTRFMNVTKHIWPIAMICNAPMFSQRAVLYSKQISTICFIKLNVYNLIYWEWKCCHYIKHDKEKKCCFCKITKTLEFSPLNKTKSHLMI